MTDETFAPGIAAISDDWIKYLPTELQESFAKAQVRSRLNALNDDTPITQDLASVYLDVSDATLKRMRASGKGPQYVQGMSEEGTKSRNQKVLYTVGSLKDWIAKNRTESTGHAAIRRGLMFQSISDLLIPEPWWEKDGNILGHARSIYFNNLPQMDWQIQWIGVYDALKCKWMHPNLRISLDQLATKILEKSIYELKAGFEQSILEFSIAAASNPTATDL